MIRKKVAIITMHKVINFGSALQTWALQNALESLGCDSKIIDYIYPNEFYYKHASPVKKKPIFQRISIKKISYYLKRKFLCKRKKQVKNFESFWEQNYNLTNKYHSLKELRESHLDADIYITGSDQVWNPQTMYGDPAFFLGFIDNNKTKISYASSFGITEIPDDYIKLYTTYLKEYKSISVREKSAVSILNKMLNCSPCLVCDPTLLITQRQYHLLANKSSIHIKQPYLLAYILDYAYNPFPAVSNIIDYVSHNLGLHVVYLLCGNLEGYKFGSTTISDAGPNEFLKLFEDASFVVTSSFHGTIFSLINNKDFYSVIPSTKKDGRISSLLSQVNLSNRGIPANENIDGKSLFIDYSKVNPYLENLRNQGLSFLQENLK